jgi:hypothetical protein
MPDCAGDGVGLTHADYFSKKLREFWERNPDARQSFADFSKALMIS